MKILFFGSSAFAVKSLSALHGSRHKVLAVVTRPDRSKGRCLTLARTPVKEEAAALDIPVIQPADINDAGFGREARALAADIFVVISFGAIFKKELLDIPEKGCVNLHASLLPKYRGAAPINRAIINGDTVSGVTVMRMNRTPDAGDIIMQEECNIGGDETAISLGDRLSRLGARSIAAALDSIESGRAKYALQDEAKASYAPMLKKEDGLIDWDLRSTDLYNRVRGLVPWPGTYTRVRGKILKIIDAQVFDAKAGARPGRVIEADPKKGIIVNTGNGALSLRTVQLEGRRAMSAQEFVRGRGIKSGDMLG